MIAAVLFITLAVLLFLTAPIFISLAGSTAITLALFSNLDLVIIIQRLFSGVNRFALMSIPLFIFAANLMGDGGISKRLIKLVNSFVGDIPGGLAMSVVLTSMFFGAISGSSPATVVAIGALLYPALVAAGYSPGFSIGIIASSGALGIIIPPSITMIVYATVTGSSVGELFVSGFGAGVMFAIPFMVYAYIYARKNKVKTVAKASWKERWSAIKESAWGIGVPVIILGGIYGGVFTPTEAAAVAAVYSLVVSMFVYREINLKKLIDVTLKSALTTVQVMILVAAASVFSWILTAQGITVSIATSILSISNNKWVILLLFNIVILVAGMFIDGASIITILGPLFFPIAVSSGIDPIHLGIVMTVNSAIGMYTPPFGLNLFVASSISKQPILKISKAIIPFILLSLIALAIITYVPQISLWLPRLVYGK